MTPGRWISSTLMRMAGCAPMRSGGIAWVGGLLKNADTMLQGSDNLLLANINDENEEGRQVLASARHILKSQGKAEAISVSLADMADIGELVAGLEFNGDGVISAKQVRDGGLRATVEDIIKCGGSVPDLSG